MKINRSKITGVLHQKESQQLYSLRRYYPKLELTDFVDQFWLVDWSLPANKTHTQRNIPDPNFHLVISHDSVKVLGPVTKVYNYTMSGKNRIIGVKFSLGALQPFLSLPFVEYVDKEIDAAEVFGKNLTEALSRLLSINNDALICEVLEKKLSPLKTSACDSQQYVQKLVSLIKDDPSVSKVSQLSERAGRSPRLIQRYFKKHIGLSAKWLIRKYRLHRVLERLDAGEVSILDVVMELEYTDQSHLIRDFKEIIGATPNGYVENRHKHD
ncbi:MULTISPECIES: helix-turn-helix domain-containing protein [Pseudidiomarina]|uniref:AraC family transcriptional regulator n=2 Tax=Pseudidiomarina TaxID=2800384 RepID=A0A368UNR4_9GAMM|nr:MULTISPECIES: helix-turn-helix domain-containing protein [Pseudidiomarina]PWW11215.1 AraC family transcriptional regulator [Pseudidiomarina maritima]RBP88485.1 AraC family transcriptional regulator [Pseudidiomarina tainanensis]RCW30437.1 AraC family transcriptional regulator [Pseudidiomarina tainanensis]